MIKSLITTLFITFITLISGIVPVNSEWATYTTCAYTANEAPNLTASGEVPFYGGVACNDLPLGTIVIINGERFVVNDRSGTPGIIDIFMYSYEDAINYGVQTVPVYIER